MEIHNWECKLVQCTLKVKCIKEFSSAFKIWQILKWAWIRTTVKGFQISFLRIACFHFHNLIILLIKLWEVIDVDITYEKYQNILRQSFYFYELVYNLSSLVEAKVIWCSKTEQSYLTLFSITAGNLNSSRSDAVSHLQGGRLEKKQNSEMCNRKNRALCVAIPLNDKGTSAGLKLPVWAWTVIFHPTAQANWDLYGNWNMNSQNRIWRPLASHTVTIGSNGSVGWPQIHLRMVKKKLLDVSWPNECEK